MSAEFKREDRYVVIKRSDLAKYTDDVCAKQLLNITEAIKLGRRADKKIPLQCVVVESDWDEYDTVWVMLEERELAREAVADKTDLDEYLAMRMLTRFRQLRRAYPKQAVPDSEWMLSLLQAAIEAEAAFKIASARIAQEKESAEKTEAEDAE